MKTTRKSENFFGIIKFQDIFKDRSDQSKYHDFKFTSKYLLPLGDNNHPLLSAGDWLQELT